MTAYDPSNLFAKMIAGAIPASGNSTRANFAMVTLTPTLRGVCIAIRDVLGVQGLGHFIFPKNLTAIAGNRTPAIQ